jgi:hypothetical protein
MRELQTRAFYFNPKVMLFADPVSLSWMSAIAKLDLVFFLALQGFF